MATVCNRCGSRSSRRHLFGPWPFSMRRILGYRRRDERRQRRAHHYLPASFFPDLVETNNYNDRGTLQSGSFSNHPPSAQYFFVKCAHFCCDSCSCTFVGPITAGLCSRQVRFWNGAKPTVQGSGALLRRFHRFWPKKSGWKLGSCPREHSSF